MTTGVTWSTRRLAPAPGAARRDGAFDATRRRTIAVLSPLLAANFFSRVMAGIRAAASEAGFGIVAVQTLEPVSSNLEDQTDSPDYRLHVGLEHAEGVIALVSAVEPAYLKAIADSGRPVVSVARAVPGLEVPVVSSDNRSGITAAIEHLVNTHGYRKIAFVGRAVQDDIAERLAAWREALCAAGITPDPDWVVEADDLVERGGVSAGRQLVARGVPFDAIVAATDYNALGLIEELRRAGVSVPGDVAVVGYDDMEEASAPSAQLSTVRQDLAELGRRAFELLDGALRGEAPAAGHHRLPAHFVCRTSCGCSLDQAMVARALGPTRREEFVGAVAGLVRDGGPRTERGELTAAIGVLADAIGAPEAADQGVVGRLARRLGPSLHRFEQVPQILELAARYGEALATTSEPATRALARQRLETRLALALSAEIAARHSQERRRLGKTLRDEYFIAMELFTADRKQATSLGFLARTPARLACLGLWPEGGGTSGALEILGQFARDGEAPLLLPEHCPAESFPPEGLVARARLEEGELVAVLPVQSEQRHWGLLALVTKLELTSVIGRDPYLQCAAQLSAALEQGELTDSLLGQQAELRHQQGELLASEERYALAVAATSDALWDYDLTTGAVFYSERWHELVGETALGSGPDELVGRVHPEDRPALSAALSACITGQQSSLSLEHRLRTADGSWRWARTRALAVPGAPSPARRIVGSTADITLQWEFEQRLWHQANHDPLTGLPNRAWVLERAEELLTLARATGQVAALFVDLDDFKTVNDGLGHDVGDAVLIEVARRLEEAVRAGDHVGRLGGDEFVVLLEPTHDRTDVAVVAERARAAIARPIVLPQATLTISASIGAAWAADGSALKLLRDADVAMYRAKDAGKNRYVALGRPPTDLAAPGA